MLKMVLKGGELVVVKSKIELPWLLTKMFDNIIRVSCVSIYALKTKRLIHRQISGARSFVLFREIYLALLQEVDIYIAIAIKTNVKLI